MAPDARRAQIVDAAHQLLTEHGLAGFTIAAVAGIAGVSVPLIYKYFENRNELLGQVLGEEYDRYRAVYAEQLRLADGFAEVVRASVRTNFEYQAPGSVLAELSGLKELEHVLAERREADPDQSGRTLLKAVRSEFPIDADAAEFLLRASSGASIAAAGDAANRGLDREEAVEAVVTFILAGITAAIDRGRPLR
jgi:AcrR family transcriptional regulator